MVRNLVTIADFVGLLFGIKGISQLLLAGKVFKITVRYQPSTFRSYVFPPWR